MGKAIGGQAQEPPLTAHREPGAEGEEVFALGGWLAKQRQLRGIRLEELAALTRLPVRSLERLEAGVFDGQQDGFVRGFVRTVAVAIGLDPEDAVARLLAEPDARPGSRLPDDLRRVAVAAVGLAGVLALLLALWEIARAPAVSEARGPEAVLVRRDAVRALANERGLLSEEPATAGPPAVLLPEPHAEAPLEGATPEVDLGRERPLGSSSPPAAQASPD
jgi:hypothetical protein